MMLKDLKTKDFIAVKHNRPFMIGKVKARKCSEKLYMLVVSKNYYLRYKYTPIVEE